MSVIVPCVNASGLAAVHYDVTVVAPKENVETIVVRASTRMDDSGVMDFDAPSQAAEDIRVEGGAIDASTAGHWRVTAPPQSAIVVTWRIPAPPPQRVVDWKTWREVVIRRDAALATAADFLAIPKDLTRRSVSTTINAPADWNVSTTLTAGDLTTDRLASQTFLVSRHAYTDERALGNGSTLTVSALGARPRDVDEATSAIVKTLADMGTNDGRPVQLKINLAVFEGTGSWASVGSSAGGTLFLSGDITPAAWLFDAIGPMVGIGVGIGIGDTRQAAADAWFTQGVTSYRLADSLLRHGFVNKAAFTRHIERTLATYGGSPLRRAPNQRVIDDYDRIREMKDVPVSRGELFAWLVDAQMREATQGRRRLADALQHMDRRSPDPGPALIAAVAAEGGGDITGIYQRYIVDGTLLQLPRDALGPSFTIGTVADEYGWQVQHVFAR